MLKPMSFTVSKHDKIFSTLNSAQDELLRYENIFSGPFDFLRFSFKII